MEKRKTIEPTLPLGFSIQDLWDKDNLSESVKEVTKEINDAPLEEGDAVQEE